MISTNYIKPICNGSICKLNLLTDRTYGYINFRQSRFPHIVINNPDVSDLTLSVTMTFSDYYISLYNNRLPADHKFALRYFIGDLSIGGFYNTTRSKRDVVSSLDEGFYDSVASSQQIQSGYTWHIELDNYVPIAREKGFLGHAYSYFPIEEYIGRPIPVGAYLSSTRDVRGRNIGKVVDMYIIYEGHEDDIYLITE